MAGGHGLIFFSNKIYLFSNLKMPLLECDRIEFDAKLKTIENLHVKTKRQLYNIMRNGAPEHTFIPMIGMTLGEICSFLVFKEKA